MNNEKLSGSASLIAKYKILMNKSNYIFTLIKIIKITANQYLHLNKTYEGFSFDNVLFDSIIQIL